MTVATDAVDSAGPHGHAHSSILHEAFWVVAGQAAGAIGSIAGVRVLTQVLDPVAYGELALGMTAAILVSQVVLAPLATSALRFFAPAQEARDLRSFFAALRRLLSRSIAAISLMMMLVAAVTMALSGFRWIPLIVASFVFATLSGTNSILDGIQNAARQRVIVAWHDGLAPWLRFGVAVALIVFLKRGASGVAMLGYVIGSVLVMRSQFFFFKKRIVGLSFGERSDALNREPWVRSILEYGWPFALWGVFAWAQLASDRWALGVFGSTRDVGLYAAIYQIGFYPILMLSQAFTQLAAPLLFAKAGDATDHDRLRSSIRHNHQLVLAVLALTAAAVATATFLHPLIARFLLAPQYRGASHFLPWMVLSGGLFATGQVAALAFMTAKRSQFLTTPKIVAAGLAVAMNFAGAELFGAAGVVGAGVIAALLYCSWLLIRTNKNLWVAS